MNHHVINKSHAMKTWQLITRFKNTLGSLMCVVTCKWTVLETWNRHENFELVSQKVALWYWSASCDVGSVNKLSKVRFLLGPFISIHHSFSLHQFRPIHWKLKHFWNVCGIIATILKHLEPRTCDICMFLRTWVCSCSFTLVWA